MPSWLEELESFSLDERNILQVIVANKVSFQKYFYAIFLLISCQIDLASERQVSTMCGQALADKFKLDYIETSARSGFNVDVVFRILAHSLSLAHLNQKSAMQKAQEIVSNQARSTEAKLRDFKRQRRSQRLNSESFRIRNSRSLDYTIAEERQEDEGNCCVA